MTLPRRSSERITRYTENAGLDIDLRTEWRRFTRKKLDISNSRAVPVNF
jgi:hypothetical protein